MLYHTEALAPLVLSLIHVRAGDKLEDQYIPPLCAAASQCCVHVYMYFWFIGRVERALLVVHQSRKCLYIYDRPTDFYVDWFKGHSRSPTMLSILLVGVYVYM